VKYDIMEMWASNVIVSRDDVFLLRSPLPILVSSSVNTWLIARAY